LEAARDDKQNEATKLVEENRQQNATLENARRLGQQGQQQLLGVAKTSDSYPGDSGRGSAAAGITSNARGAGNASNGLGDAASGTESNGRGGATAGTESNGVGGAAPGTASNGRGGAAPAAPGTTSNGRVSDTKCCQVAATGAANTATMKSAEKALDNVRAMNGLEQSNRRGKGHGDAKKSGGSCPRGSSREGAAAAVTAAGNNSNGGGGTKSCHAAAEANAAAVTGSSTTNQKSRNRNVLDTTRAMNENQQAHQPNKERKSQKKEQQLQKQKVPGVTAKLGNQHWKATTSKSVLELLSDARDTSVDNHKSKKRPALAMPLHSAKRRAGSTTTTNVNNSSNKHRRDAITSAASSPDSNVAVAPSPAAAAATNHRRSQQQQQTQRRSSAAHSATRTNSGRVDNKQKKRTEGDWVNLAPDK